MPELNIPILHDQSFGKKSFPPDETWDANNATAYIYVQDNVIRFNYRYNSRHEINIPVGSIINSATFTYTAVDSSVGTDTLNYQLINEDDTPPFDNTSPGKTTGTIVNWTNVPEWIAGAKYTSVDISVIVQAFVDRAGYQPGNHIGIQHWISLTGISSLREAKAAGANGPRLNLSVTVPSLADNLYQTPVISDDNRGTALSRSSRLYITGNGQDLVTTEATDETQWQIFLADQEINATATTARPYPIIVSTFEGGETNDYTNITQGDINYLDIWFPPYENFKFRARRKFNDASDFEKWSSMRAFTSPGYMNSFEIYQLLSGETINPIIIT